ncbi:MAG: hypothetical protein M1816_002683 [Peltula sp. TS41687]|nr:MAG: hypothetical protein M1816_002683 [Peltula sp. TS41687]
MPVLRIWSPRVEAADTRGLPAPTWEGVKTVKRTAFFDNASALGDEQEKKAEGNADDGENQSPPVNHQHQWSYLQGILRSEACDRHQHVPPANSVHENTQPGNGQSELQAKQPSETQKHRSTLDEQTDAMGGVQILGLSALGQTPQSTQAIDAARSALPFYTNELPDPSWTPALNSDVNGIYSSPLFNI